MVVGIILSSVLSVIAILISIFTFCYNKAIQDRKQFQEFINNFYIEINKFMKFCSFDFLYSYRFDFENIAINNFGQNSFYENYSNECNCKHKEIATERDKITSIYNNLFIYLNSLNKKNIVLHIKLFEELLNQTYINLNEFYDTLTTIYNDFMNYIIDKVDKEDYINNFNKLYKYMFETSVYKEGISRYVMNMNDITNKMMLNMKDYKIGKKYCFKPIFQTVWSRLDNEGILNYLATKDCIGLEENFKIVSLGYKQNSESQCEIMKESVRSLKENFDKTNKKR